MVDDHDVVEAALAEVKRLKRTIARGNGVQVRSREEKDLVNATAMSWFKNHMPVMKSSLQSNELADVNAGYKSLLLAAGRATTRATYRDFLTQLANDIVTLRGSLVDAVTARLIVPAASDDVPPDFSPLVVDDRMRRILTDRWRECSVCVQQGAPLAATVMMGGLLETLLLARYNMEPDKKKIFKSSCVPKDSKTGKPKPLQDWTLKYYIDVAHDLKWISHSAKETGEVMRDYRNYVHPYKQMSHGVHLEPDDAEMFWTITKSIARQLITKLK